MLMARETMLLLSSQLQISQVLLAFEVLKQKGTGKLPSKTMLPTDFQSEAEIRLFRKMHLQQ